MKTPSSTPERRPEYSSIANGLSQESEGSIDLFVASSVIRATAATTMNRTRAPTWARAITRWTFAESSVPITQIAVITATMTTAKTITAVRDRRRSSRPNRSKM